MRLLREGSREGLIHRYGLTNERAHLQIERELTIIEKLDLAGYFLIVWDIVRFCREQNILVQGRGSAANSAVCNSLETPAADPLGREFLFDGFFSDNPGKGPTTDLNLPTAARPKKAIHSVNHET